MRARSLKYFLVYLTPLIVLFSLNCEEYYTFLAIVFVFVFIPFVELFTKASTTNLDKIEEEIAKADRFYDWLLYGLVPLQYIILAFFLQRVSNYDLSTLTKIGITTAFGISCGILGINAAHELGHRTTWYEQLMSKMLLFTTLYLHFFIEHNRGHHKNVSTDEDPASSRIGESVYAFYFRSIWGGWKSAFRLESERLKRNGFPFWSIKNEMLIFQVIQLSFLIGVTLVYGIRTCLFFILGAGIGILLLETVNYIEHYGLRRKKVGDKYERTLPVHSWNSNHPLGRLVLLELSRHSDHHYIASRKYQLLRHFDESPQMPAGYPGMMIISLFPPLWFKLMNNRIDEYRKKLGG